MSVTRGQCDARSTVTFVATRHHRPLAGTKLYCLVIEARWRAFILMILYDTLDKHIASLAARHCAFFFLVYISLSHCAQLIINWLTDWFALPSAVLTRLLSRLAASLGGCVAAGSGWVALVACSRHVNSTNIFSHHRPRVSGPRSIVESLGTDILSFLHAPACLCILLLVRQLQAKDPRRLLVECITRLEEPFRNASLLEQSERFDADFYPRDALHSAVFAVVRCLSVCLSVTRRYCV